MPLGMQQPRKRIPCRYIPDGIFPGLMQKLIASNVTSIRDFAILFIRSPYFGSS